MIRDKIKDKEYFEKYLSEEYDDIQFYQDKLDNNELREDRINPVKRQIYGKKIGILKAKYSIGEDIFQIRENFLKYINLSIDSWSNDYNAGYVQVLWLLSIGLLLKIEKQEFSKLVALVDKENLKDYLIDFIIAQRIEGREISQNLIFESLYKKLENITKMSKQDASTALKIYLEKFWYKGHSDMAWYESHKNKNNIYSGYWSFDSAAITAIMNLEDKDYASNPYYPKDLVDFYRSNEVL